MIVYYNNNFSSVEEVHISPFDRGLFFSDSVYEVMRTYNRKVFYSDKHIERLCYSLNELKIPLIDFLELEKIIMQLADYNNISNDFSIYLQVTRGTDFPRTHSFDTSILPNIFIYVSAIKNHDEELKNGVKVILEKDTRWERCDIKSTALISTVLANKKAQDKKCYEAFFYRNNKLTEGSHTNIFAVKDSQIFTTPLSNFILKGITRGVVIQICNDNHIPIIEDFININDLQNYDEFFITGTTTEVTPVININDKSIGDGTPGSITRKLQKKFFDLTSNFQ